MTYEAGINRSSPGRIAFALLASLALFMVFAFSSVPMVNAAEHCPDGGTKVEGAEAEAAGDLVLDAGTLFCVKKGTGASAQLTADGVTTLYEYLVQAGLDGEVGEGPSYYVTYGTVGGDDDDDDDRRRRCDDDDDDDDDGGGGGEADSPAGHEGHQSTPSASSRQRFRSS